MGSLTLFSALRCLLEIHLLTIVGYAAFALGWKLARPRQAAVWVRFGQGVLFLAVALPLLTTFIPKKNLWRPRAQIWSGAPRAAEPYTLLAPIPAASRGPVVPAGMKLPARAMQFMLGMVSLGVLLSLLRVGQRRRQLARFLAAQLPWKRRGRARVLVTSEAIVPFSARWRGKAYVVLPAVSLGTPTARVALRHEAVHHRRGDTAWAHTIEVLRALLFGNPVFGALARRIEWLQELACDDAVVAGGIPARDYGLGLLQVAQWSSKRPADTLAMATTPSFLRRRIERVLTVPTPDRRSLTAAVGVALSLLLLSIAIGLRSTVQDRRLSERDARKLAAVSSGIPLDVNELVLAYLNHFVGTPEGRRRVQNGFRRMPAFRAMIEARLHEYGIPDEILAIPLIESSFDTKAVSPGVGAAGIWQFMAQTARRYGLIVEPGRRDDRLQPEGETLAAMRYLRDLHREFGDWRLAIKAYNEGEDRVRELIAKLGTREPWTLERHSSPDRY